MSSPLVATLRHRGGGSERREDASRGHEGVRFASPERSEVDSVDRNSDTRTQPHGDRPEHAEYMGPSMPLCVLTFPLRLIHRAVQIGEQCPSTRRA